jgi:hypothetical protein
MIKSFLSISLLVLAGHLFAQTADDIINKHFEATGGKEKWAKVYAMHSSGNYVLGPGMLAPVNHYMLAKPFKGVYNDFTWQGMTAKHAMRADSGWNYQPFNGKRDADPMSPNEIRSYKLGADPQGLLFNYKEKGYTVEYLGTDDMDGSDVYKLRLATQQGDMVYYYIDMETNYILKEVTRIKLKDKEEKNSVIYSDFRKTEYGITVPYSMQDVDDDGNTQGGPVNFTKVEVNTTMDVSLFDKPKSK